MGEEKKGKFYDKSEGDLRLFLFALLFVLFFDLFDVPPPGNPSRLKLMPKIVGSISTRADFLSGFCYVTCLDLGES